VGASHAPSGAGPGRTWIAPALLPAGVVLTLCGLIGDLVVHTANPAAHRNEELISFRPGMNPWHLVLFAGIVLTALGAIRWAVRLRSDWGGFLGAMMSMLLIAVAVLGGYAAVRGRDGATTAGAIGSSNALQGHSHDQAAGLGGHHHSASGAAAGTEGAGHTRGTPGPVTAAQARVLQRQLASAKRSSARYGDIDAARADGYFQVTQFIPGLGLHLVNLSIPDDVFNPSRPQILLYEPTRSGKLRLVGVAYQFRHTPNTPPDGFAGGSDVWHFHTNLCFLKGGTVTIAGSEIGCNAAGGLVFQKRTDWLLHAWIWKANPRGVFTEINPTVH